MWPGESRGDSAGSNCGAPMAIAGEEPGKHGPGAGFAARQRGIPAGIEGGLGALPGRPGPRRLLAISVRVARVNRGSSICCAPDAVGRDLPELCEGLGVAFVGEGTYAR